MPIRRCHAARRVVGDLAAARLYHGEAIIVMQQHQVRRADIANGAIGRTGCRRCRLTGRGRPCAARARLRLTGRCARGDECDKDDQRDDRGPAHGRLLRFRDLRFASHTPAHSRRFPAQRTELANWIASSLPEMVSSRSVSGACVQSSTFPARRTVSGRTSPFGSWITIWWGVPVIQ
jgi:hypothetical protein